MILGSNSAAYDEHVQRQWFNRELTLMGEAVMNGVPIFGICFGAQALCIVNGGEVVKAAESEIGWYDIDVVEGCAIPTGPWFEYHSDQCIVSDDTTVLASSPRAVQAFSFGRNLGVQFHPEIDDEQLARWFASTSSEPRAHTEHETELLERTRMETPAARGRVLELIDYFIALSAIA